ncbi:MAG: hypothetical protein KDC12_14075 [Flavobacteriales bacterium]|nr:hypothetical protein [Flavobacteriales bacterium]
MKTIFILSFNNLGLDFWKTHLHLDQSEKVYQFRKGEPLLKSINFRPDLVVIDDYFASQKPGDLNAQDVIDGIKAMLPKTKCLHISPSFSNDNQYDRENKVMRSNFNSDLLEKVRSWLLPKPKVTQ